MLQPCSPLPPHGPEPIAPPCSADVNECELMVAVCGTALCENVEGSFLCLCPSDHEEYDTEAGQCQPRAAMGEKRAGQERGSPGWGEGEPRRLRGCQGRAHAGTGELTSGESRGA